MTRHSAAPTPKIDRLVRSNRTSIGLEVLPDGRLVVRAPRHVSMAQINAAVTNKADWIKQTQARLARKYLDLKPKTFQPGETFWYLGEQYPLRLTDQQRPLLELDGSFYLARSAQEQAREVFIAWYREETRQITADTIKAFSQSHGFRVNQVRVTSARTRWGSCSGKGNLNFTYRLCMAPPSVVTYVVVHELVHFKIRNHSKAFWQAIAAIKPDYQQDRRWLKRCGALLTLD